MLHEVLLTLWGCSGSLFSEKKGQANLVKFIEPGEKVILKRIFHHAEKHMAIRKFIDNVSYNNYQVGDGEPHKTRGTYLQAFANGMDCVLEPYRKDIVQLEQQALKDQYLPLTYVLSTIESHSEVLQALAIVIRQISENDLHGCQLLECVHQQLTSGVEPVQEAMQKIQLACHAVLFNHLSSWLLYGDFINNYNEFFICYGKLSNSYSESEKVGYLTRADNSLAGSSVTSVNTLQLTEFGSDKEQCDNLQFYINYEMLPSYISHSLALKILFVGKTILMFKGSHNEYSEDFDVPEDYIAKFWGSKEYEFYKKLHKSQVEEKFNVCDMEKTVNEMRLCILEHLWKLAVEDANLVAELKLLKDFYLLGRGDLFMEFINQARSILDRPSTGSSRDLNQAFQISARMILFSDDSVMEKFAMSLPKKDRHNAENSNIGWKVIGLSYKVNWPLHLIFTDTVLQIYNQLFRFLLHLKKTQLDLHSVWGKLMAKKFNRHSSLWPFLRILSFLIDNLQYYLQVDVIESEFSTFMNAVANTKDFEHVQKLHTVFQSNLIQCGFILFEPIKHSESIPLVEALSPIRTVLQNMLAVCENFCTEVDRFCDDQTDQDAMNDVNKNYYEFSHLLNVLIELLSGLCSLPCGSHLSQLLQRLDYNHWFGNNKLRALTDKSMCN